MTRDFWLYLVSRLVSATAATLLRSCVAWHVYQLSESAFHLGLIGLVQFLPALGLTLVGGAVADSHDRRRIINIAQVISACAGATLFLVTRADAASLSILYAMIVLVSCAGAFESPARAALMPTLVKREWFPRAVTISATNQALAFASGPALGGLVIATWGVATVYAVFVILVAVGFGATLALRAGGGHGGPRRAVTLAAIREGLLYVRRQPVVLGCMTLDLFAVIFGGATALLPIYAREILHVDARGYGILTSSLEAGALTMSLLLLWLPPVRHAGRTLLAAVFVFGVATIVFGLSRAFPLSVAAYAIAGMADQVSVVMRATAIQLATPDELRGRVSAVNFLFIGASNQLGAVESGWVAALTSAPFSVVSGGVCCLVTAAIVAWALPELRRYRVDRF